MYYRALNNGPRSFARTGWLYEQNGADPFVPLTTAERWLIGALETQGKVYVASMNGIDLELMMMSKGVAEYTPPAEGAPNMSNGTPVVDVGRLTGRIHYPFDREDPRYPLVQSVN